MERMYCSSSPFLRTVERAITVMISPGKPGKSAHWSNILTANDAHREQNTHFQMLMVLLEYI